MRSHGSVLAWFTSTGLMPHIRVAVRSLRTALACCQALVRTLPWIRVTRSVSSVGVLFASLPLIGTGSKRGISVVQSRHVAGCAQAKSVVAYPRVHPDPPVRVFLLVTFGGGGPVNLVLLCLKLCYPR